MDLLTLLNAIDDTYSEPELQGLCAKLGVDYRFLPGYAKRHKAMELVATMQRRDELQALASIVAAERPALAAALQPIIRSLEENLDWLEADAPPPAAPANGAVSSNSAGVSNGVTGSNGHSNGVYSQKATGRDRADQSTDTGSLVAGSNGTAGLADLAIAPTTKGYEALAFGTLDDDEEDELPEPEQVVELPSPYSPGRAVTEPEMFFGRAAETGLLLDAMLNGQHMIVVGPQRIGKSSLLHHIPTALPQDSHILHATVDLQQPRNHGGARVAQAAWEQWWAGVRPGTNPVIDNARVFDVLVRKLQAADYRLILLLDNLEQLVWRPRAFDPALLETLLALATDHAITILAASRLSVGELGSAAEGRAGEALGGLLRLLRPLDLSLLDMDAARELVTVPVRARGLAVPDDAAAHLLDIAGPHPFFLHLAGLYLFEGLTQSAYDADGIAEQFAAAAEPFWQQSWETLSPLAQTQLMTEILRPDGPVAARQMRILATRGLLLPEGDGYRPFSRGMGAWLGRLRSAQSAAGL